MRSERAVVVGAGIGGLVAALDLSSRGIAVTLVERGERVGGKLRAETVAGRSVDSGPTVLTLKPVFDALFASWGEDLDAHLSLEPSEILARHAWDEGPRLDLFADPARSADAIGDFAGAREAAGFRAFAAQAARAWRTLAETFVAQAQPSLVSLVASASFADLWAIRPFESLWRALGSYFDDPRLRQLFGRYATYCGSSPFLAPATLMLIADVEMQGVWRVEGGMRRLAEVLEALALERGVEIVRGTAVRSLTTGGGRVSGVILEGDERREAATVVLAVDTTAVAGGLFGAQAARALPRAISGTPSLSALTWAMTARAEGFPLVRHTVFFGADYPGEFEALFAQGRLPDDPTVYVCAQDRGDAEHRADAGPGGEEALFVLVNAPARGDAGLPSPEEIRRCEERTFARLARCGLTLHPKADPVRTTPEDFARRFPGTGGALYGRATHGWRASFARPQARTRLPGLYLAGGSVHPGAGLPMAALSGRMAAAAALADLSSIRRSRPGAMSGGISTR